MEVIGASREGRLAGCYLALRLEVLVRRSDMLWYDTFQIMAIIVTLAGSIGFLGWLIPKKE